MSDYLLKKKKNLKDSLLEGEGQKVVIDFEEYKELQNSSLAYKVLEDENACYKIIPPEVPEEELEELANIERTLAIFEARDYLKEIKKIVKFWHIVGIISLSIGVFAVVISILGVFGNV